MEKVERFIAAGKVWAVQSIVSTSEVGEWDRVTIVGVRPSGKRSGIFELIEIEGMAPRFDLGKEQAPNDPSWQLPTE
jgi:hypothetical protein